MLVFVRTKLETTELAERLTARGFNAAELNGDIPQQQRERTITRLKNRQLDIVVATDVAARGIDVERISHVVNYDIPYDSETYIHRIGRTGRAGRAGDAILFVAPRERNMLRIIEKHTRQRIEPMQLPSVEAVNEQRVARFKERIAAAVQSGEGKVFLPLLEQFEQDGNVPAIEIAAALAGLLQGSAPFLLAERQHKASGPRERSHDDTVPHTPAGEPPDLSRLLEEPPRRRERPAHADEREERHPHGRRPREEAPPMETFRIEVGHAHGAQPGNIVGAIANEAGVDGRHIGHIDIHEDHSFVDLPVGMPEDIFNDLQHVQVRGTPLRISRVDGKPPRKARAGGFRREGFQRDGGPGPRRPGHGAGPRRPRPASGGPRKPRKF